MLGIQQKVIFMVVECGRVNNVSYQNYSVKWAFVPQKCVIFRTLTMFILFLMDFSMLICI